MQINLLLNAVHVIATCNKLNVYQVVRMNLLEFEAIGGREAEFQLALFLERIYFIYVFRIQFFHGSSLDVDCGRIADIKGNNGQQSVTDKDTALFINLIDFNCE